MSPSRPLVAIAGTLLLLNAIIASVAAHNASPTKKTNQRPVVSVSDPVDGATYDAHAEVVIRADAHDVDGRVRSVRFYVDSKPIGVAMRAPYTAEWHHAVPGTHLITAEATDDLGAETMSSAVRVTVKRDQPPQVNIESPADGSRFFVPASIDFTANASDVDGKIRQGLVPGGLQADRRPR